MGDLPRLHSARVPLPRPDAVQRVVDERERPRASDRRLRVHYDSARQRLSPRTALSRHRQRLHPGPHRHLQVLFSPRRSLIRREVCLDRHKFLIDDAKPSISLLRQFFQKLSETEEVMIALLQQPHNARPRRGERTSSPPVPLRPGNEA